MNSPRPPVQFGQVLDRLSEAGDDSGRITIAAMLDVVGRRSYGPLLMLPGLVVFSPLSGIPLLPTTMGAMVLLVAGQLLLGRKHCWLPQWLMKRSAPRDKFDKALRFLRPVANVADRLTRRRWSMLTRDIAVRVIAVICIVIAAAMPALELIPFSSSVAGAAFTAFGLGLIAEDGALVLVALALCAGVAILGIRAFLG